MQKMRCLTHNLCLELPDTDEEFLSGHMHETVVKLHEHHKLYPKCRFVEEVFK